MIHDPKTLTAEERRERAKERRIAEREQEERFTRSSTDALRRMIERQQARKAEPEKRVGYNDLWDDAGNRIGPKPNRYFDENGNIHKE